MQSTGNKAERKEKIIEFPSYHNAFVGRNHQIKLICSHFEKEPTKLITLHGPGGMGKTRLSVKIGEELCAVFEHGVCFVPLDTLTDHREVAQHIGKQLGLKESFQNSWSDTIIHFLVDKHLLLILDNLEQILESRALISRMLEACSRLKILATSREFLGLPEEMNYSLESLYRPNPHLFPEPRNLMKFEAIALFVERAQFAVPNFQITQENAEAVVQICNLLEGLPLPIELAAARLKLFSPQVIFLKLSESNQLLKTKNRQVSLRHQTIRNMVKWSYDLLDEEEQHLFQQLAVFRDGFTLNALETICPEVDALEIVESFINKSLVVRGKEIALVPRFKMLKLIRDYGLEQLENNPEKSAYLEKFANYFLTFAQETSATFRTSDRETWIRLIDAEHANISAAMEWLIAHQAEKATQMGAGLWVFYLDRGFLKEGLSMIETLLSLQTEEKEIRAKLLEAAGALSHNQGNYRKAKEYFEHSLALGKQLDHKGEIARALNNLGWMEWRIGNYDATIAYAKSAFEIFGELKDESGQAKSQNNLAWTFQCRGIFEEAARLQQLVLEIHKKTDNRREIAFAKVCLGKALMKLGRNGEAEIHIQEAILLFSDLKHQQLLAFSRLILAEYQLQMENGGAAKNILVGECLPGFEKIGDVWGIASSHQLLGEIFFLEKNLAEAKTQWEQALSLFRNSYDRFGEAGTCLGLSRLFHEMNQISTAENHLEQGLTLASDIQANELLMNAYWQKALLHQQSSSVQSLQFLAIADYFAEKLGNHLYQQFHSSIRSFLEDHILSFPQSNEEQQRIGAELWELSGNDSDLPIELEDIQSRIQKLLGYDLEIEEPPKAIELSTSSVSSKPVEEDPFLRHVRQIVEANLADPDFSVKVLCKEIGISHSQLHRKLSSRTGKSITQYIRFMRLEKARELLKDPKRTVAAVAYDTGFKDPDYFYRVFRKAFQMTPAEYRKRAASRP